MGKNQKQKAKSNENFARCKRKVSDTDESPVKSKKAKEEAEWFPGKFVLLNKKNGSETPVETPTNPPKLDKKKANKNKKQKQSKSTDNGESSAAAASQHVQSSKKSKQQNGKSNKINSSSLLSSLYNGDLDTSDDSFDEGEFESLSEEEQVSEEWQTDTDYEMEEEQEDSCYSDSDSDDSNAQYDCDYDSNEDSDYAPPHEDVYIAKGTAKIYDAKGLDLAFGNSTESQIIEVSDVQPAQEITSESEEIPRLVTLDGEEVDEDDEMDADDEDEDMGNETEKLIKELQIDDEEDGICESTKSHLLANANFYNCNDNQGVLLVLKDTIHFHGVLSIKAFVSCVQINGYELTEGSTLSAKSISHADFFLNLTPVIREAAAVHRDLRSELSGLLSADTLETLCSRFNPQTECLLHLREGSVDSKLQMLINYLPHALLPSRKMLLANKICQSSQLLLSTRFFLAHENREVSSFELNEQWSNLQLNSNSRFLIAGGKNVGKSSLAQYLINANVEKFGKILLIDLDIGQPIAHAAQTISATLVAKPIIGLGCLDDTLLPVKSLLYGDKNVMISPFKYVRCIRELMDFCAANKKLENVPWIINTMGYQKGFGLQLIALLIRLMRPTDVVQIQHGIKSYNFAKILTESLVNGIDFSFFDNDAAMVGDEVSFTTHVVDSIVNNRNSAEINGKWISNASEKRKMLMIAQMAKLLKGNLTLHDVTPYKASINKFRTVVIDEDFSHENHCNCNLDLLNANLVYLCSDGSSTESPTNTPLSSDVVYECFGVGLVRGIDKVNQQVYILLPNNIDGLEKRTLQAKVNVLAICNISLPAEILLKQGYGVNGKLPYVACYRDKIQSANKYFSKRHIKDCF